MTAYVTLLCVTAKLDLLILIELLSCLQKISIFTK